jgi:light-regulated signal transduction histidine kinase (bacteriophytochrome)
VWPGGEVRHIEGHAVVLRADDGTAKRMIGVNWDITARKSAEEKVNQLNVELEQRVVERTAQLVAANKELEAFSYSVSHDLRAPLRAVDGFSQAVVNDFGALLPAEGRRQLAVIRASAQRMGALIDDLLSFSRLSRQPVKAQTVDTDQLVRAVLAELHPPGGARPVTINLGDLPPCEGDPTLLRQVWVNLLANALKYTGKRDPAVVEIGCREQSGESVYFVRDNGCGFDMRYAGKLFGVFQRLHRAEDYEGTGVGLAIVQRIVHRHGGRVWTDAAVDRGATFYFTLKGGTKP